MIFQLSKLVTISSRQRAVLNAILTPGHGHCTTGEMVADGSHEGLAWTWQLAVTPSCFGCPALTVTVCHLCLVFIMPLLRHSSNAPSLFPLLT
jgi:hypothetical protein